MRQFNTALLHHTQCDISQRICTLLGRWEKDEDESLSKGVSYSGWTNKVLLFC